MGNYDTIQIPVQGQPLSVSQYGLRVRNAIVDIDTRLSRIESTLSNYAFKQTATTRASTTTLSDDPDMKVWLEANSKYFIEMFVTCAALAAADITTAWSIPTGTASFNRRVIGPGTGSTANTNADNLSIKMGTHNWNTPVTYNGARDSNTLQFQLQEIGVITVGPNAGYLALQWAQGTSNATGTIVYDNSFCRATKLP